MADILAQTLKSVFCLLGQSYEEWSVPLVKARKAALSFLASLSDYLHHLEEAAVDTTATKKIIFSLLSVFNKNPSKLGNLC